MGKHEKKGSQKEKIEHNAKLLKSQSQAYAPSTQECSCKEPDNLPAEDASFLALVEMGSGGII